MRTTRGSFCERKAINDFHAFHFCEACGKAFREGFEHGKVFESIRRRQTGRM